MTKHIDDENSEMPLSASPEEIALLENDDSKTAALLKAPVKKESPADDAPEKQSTTEVEDQNEDDDEDDDEDEEVSTKDDSESDDLSELEKKRVRRRHERKQREIRKREKAEQLERQVQALAAKNQMLERQVAGIQNHHTAAQVAQLDQAIEQADATVVQLQSIISDAVTKADGATVAEANRAMMLAHERARDLKLLKQNSMRAQSAPPTLNPLLVNQVQKFLGKHTWYGGPQSNDPDSRIMRMVDDGVAADGFDPTTPAYYTELEKRAKKYLPHRFEKQQEFTMTIKDTAKKSPVAGASSGTSKPGTVNVQISAERVKAMKEAGIWEDPVRREKMIKTYRELDKQARSN